MAEKLMQYYKYIAEKKGLEGRQQLAGETKIPSIIAANTPDSPENIQLFKKAIEKITRNIAPDF
jgi:hypothetical protein